MSAGSGAPAFCSSSFASVTTAAQNAYGPKRLWRGLVRERGGGGCCRFAGRSDDASVQSHEALSHRIKYADRRPPVQHSDVPLIERAAPKGGVVFVLKPDIVPVRGVHLNPCLYAAKPFVSATRRQPKAISVREAETVLFPNPNASAVPE